MPSDTARASVLATLPQLGLDGLPAPVSNAVAATLALRPPDPPPAAHAVIDAVAVKAFAAAAAKGSDVIEIDPEPVARAAEAGHADRAAILAAIRDRAPIALCTIVDQQRAQIIGALQAKHAAILGQFVPAARRPASPTGRPWSWAGGSASTSWPPRT